MSDKEWTFDKKTAAMELITDVFGKDDLIRRTDAAEALAGWNISPMVLMPVKSAQKWISCSERVPEDDRTVLVTLKWGQDDYEITTGEFWHNSRSSPGWGSFEGYVIAWMPLPEPYKEGDTDEHRH